MIDTVLQIPPFNIRLRSPFSRVREHLDFYYRDLRRGSAADFIDFDVEVLPARALRRWWRPQARFLLDGVEPFFPLPADQAGPMFEWGLNWCVAQRALGLQVLHAAVVERDGRALVMPGFPGAGKSTLCAALTHIESWRLLSDELALLDPATNRLYAHPRPISVKNASIELVRAFPGARVGPVYEDTRKGTISHLACPSDSLARAATPAQAAWVVFPRFVAGSELTLEPVSRTEAFTWISEQSFNKERMGQAGFSSLCNLLDASRCWELNYGSTAAALEGVRRICAA